MGINILVEVLECVNFAILQNHINPISKLSIETDVEADNLLLRIWWENNFSKEQKLTIERMEANTTCFIENIDFEVDYLNLAVMKEPIEEVIHIALYNSHSELIEEQSSNITIYPIFKTALFLQRPWLISAFITPNSPEVTQFLRASYEEYAKENPELVEFIQNEVLNTLPNPVDRTEDSAAQMIYALKSQNQQNNQKRFLGYQNGNSKIIDIEVRCILKHLISYNLNIDALENSLYGINTLRANKVILEEKRGNILEIATLINSLLERIGLSTGFIFSQNRVFIAYWEENRFFNDIIFDDFDLLKELIVTDKLTLIDPLSVVNENSLELSPYANFERTKNLFINSKNIELMEDVLKNYLVYVDVKKSRTKIAPLPNVESLKTGDQSRVDLFYDKHYLETLDSDIFVQKEKAIRNSENTNVESWEDSLLNIRLGNRLLNIKDSFPYLSFGGGASFKSFLGLLGLSEDGKRKAISLNEVLEADPNNQRIFKNILAESHDALLETSDFSLTLCFGTMNYLETKASQSTHIAPLLLLRVEVIENEQGVFLRALDDTFTVNFTLIKMLIDCYNLDFSITDLIDFTSYQGSIDLPATLFRDQVMDLMWQMAHQLDFVVENKLVLANFSGRNIKLWLDLYKNHGLFKRSAPFMFMAENKPYQVSIDKRLSKFKDLKDQKKNYNFEFEFDKPEANKKKAHELGLKMIYDIDDSQVINNYRDIDDFIPENSVLVEPSDAYQVRALKKSLDQESFMLISPPGTGKTRAITNIIANQVFRGKKVLYVSEKRASLKEITDSLAKIKLDKFTLDLSDSSKNFELYNRLLELTKDLKLISNDNELDDNKRQAINEISHDLDNYVDLMHSTKNAPISFCESINGCLEYLYDLDFRLSEETLASLTRENIYRAKKVILELFGLAKKLNIDFTNQPLAAIKANNIPKSFRDKGFDYANPDFKNTINKLTTKQESLGVSLGLDKWLVNLNNFSKFNNFIDSIKYLSFVDTGLLRNLYVGFKLEEIEDLISKAKALKNLSDKLGPNAIEFTAIDLKDIEQKWDSDDSKFVLMKLSGHRKHIAIFEKLAQGAFTVNENNFKAYLHMAQVFKRDRSELENQSERLKRVSEHFHKLIFNDAEKAQDVLKQTMQMLEHIKTLNLDSLENGFIVKLNEISKSVNKPICDHLRKLQVDYENDYARFKFVYSELYANLQFDEDCFNQEALGFYEMVEKWQKNFSMIDDWIKINELMKVLSDLNLGEFTTLIREGKIKARDADSALLFIIYRSVFESSLKSNPELKDLNGDLLNDKITKFKNLVDEFIIHSRNLIVNKLIKVRNALNQEGRLNDLISALTLHEQKLKDILANNATEVLELAPITVSTLGNMVEYLSIEAYHYDLVIIDEANMMATYNGALAILRGNQAIINGDLNGLTPYKRFTTHDTRVYGVNTSESVLSLIDNLKFSKVELLRHYRSKSESLISFSNKYVYHNKLTTFKSYDETTSKVVFVPVETPENSKTNAPLKTNVNEAKEVVNCIKNLVVNNPDTTVGVITLTKDQANLIASLLEEAYEDNSELLNILSKLKYPIFIKSIDSIGGDSRDVIILSVGLTPNKEGNYSYNYSSLSRFNGINCLNTAVTRARYNMLVFSSLDPKDMRIYDSDNKGIMGLYNFLNYAKFGATTLGKEVNKETDFVIRDICKLLKSKGYQYEINLGTSNFKIDIAVRNPEKPDEYLAAILFDGINYARSSYSSYDANVAINGLLKDLGWKVIRAWTVDWLHDYDAARSTILRKLKA